jgi:hypothetical protein
MSSQPIDHFLNEALESFSHWLKSNQWRGKEHDCVNLFAHEFLFKKIAPDAAVHSLTQIRIECGLKQPVKGNYDKKSARKDLVIWEEPFQNSWSEEWEPVNIPKAVMEWKVRFRSKHRKGGFNSHDLDWIRHFTEENPNCIGYIVLVDLFSEPRKIEWKQSKQGVLSQTVSI